MLRAIEDLVGWLILLVTVGILGLNLLMGLILAPAGYALMIASLVSWLWKSIT
jgi:hypothetical protein